MPAIDHEPETVAAGVRSAGETSPVTEASRNVLDRARPKEVPAYSHSLAERAVETDTSVPEQITSSIDLTADTDALKIQTQGLAPMSGDRIGAARIDLDLGPADSVRAALRWNAGQGRGDLSATAPQTPRQGEDGLALPAVAAALQSAGMRLAEGGAHARLPDGMGAPHALAAREARDAIDSADIVGDASDVSDLQGTVETNGAAESADVTGMPDRTRAIGELQTGEAARSGVDTFAKTRDRIDPDLARLTQDTRVGESTSHAQMREARRMGTLFGTLEVQEYTAARASQVVMAPSVGDRANLRPEVETPSAPRDSTFAALAKELPDPTAENGWSPAHLARDSDTSMPDRTSILDKARAGAQGSEPQAQLSNSASRTREAIVRTEGVAAGDAALPGAASAPMENQPRTETALADRNVASAWRRDTLEQTARGPAVTTGSELAGHPAWPAAPATTSHRPESRAARPAPPSASIDSARATSRIAVTGRESTQARTEARLALADLTSPPATAPLIAVTQSAWTGAFDAALRTVEITDSNRHRDADARALAAGTLPATSADNTFSAALDLTGPALPEFMLRESLDSPAFAPALSARIATLVRDGVEEARIQVNPADMGPVAVQLAMEGSDVRVDLAAELESTRQILEQALPSLASALRESGFTLTGGGVFQQPRDTSGGGQAPQNGRRGRAGTDPADARVSTVSLAGTGRQPPRGLVDLYA